MVQEERARVIVYASTRGEVDVLAQALDGLPYYSDSGGAEEKAEHLQRWVDGSTRVMVATSAFGPGVDYPSVRGVFHVGMPDNAIDFAQEVGRAGRDGGGGVSSVLLRQGGQVDSGRESEKLLPAEVRVMRAFVGAPRCRVAVLSQYLDEVTWYCDDPERCCDRCGQLGLRQGKGRNGKEGGEGRGIGAGWQQGVEGEGAEGREEEGESGSSSEAEDLEVGARMLRQHIRDEGRGLRRYVQGLERWAGRCVICWLDPVGGWTDGKRGTGPHSLDECRNPQKYRFFDAKRTATTTGRVPGRGEGGSRQGWLADFTACFRCGNPQAICPAQGQGRCEYRDVVFPASWVMFQWGQWRTEKLRELAGREFEEEAEYMLWLGLETTMYGLQASNAMKVTAWVMQNCVH